MKLIAVLALTVFVAAAGCLKEEVADIEQDPLEQMGMGEKIAMCRSLCTGETPSQKVEKQCEQECTTAQYHGGIEYLDTLVRHYQKNGPRT